MTGEKKKLPPVTMGKPEKTYWSQQDIDEFTAFAVKAKSFLAWATAAVIIVTVAILLTLVIIVAKVLSL